MSCRLRREREADLTGGNDMFKDEAAAVCNTARGKLNLLEKNPAGYLMMSMLAGLFIGLGSILMGTVAIRISIEHIPQD